MTLPDDLVAFLRSGRTLEYDVKKCECGKVVFHPLQSIEVVELQLNSYQSNWAWEDPHADDEGSYIVPAYNLLASCEGYSSYGLLVYVHSQDVYGSYDDDHKDLLIFPRASWWNLVGDPIRYLTATWYPQRGTGATLNPIGDYEFRFDPDRRNS